MQKFATLQGAIGYISKPDRTNAPEGALVSGSQNVLINDQSLVETRGGYTRYGAANTALNAVESSYDWEHSRNGVLNLRAYDDELEVGFTPSSGTFAWYRILDAWTAVDFVFTTWWDTGEDLDLLLFVNGNANIYEWSGGIAEVLSATSNSITKRGTTTWAEERFYTSRNRSIVIGGTTYAYTGGAGTTTLTGVTPDPSAGGVVAGNVAIQAVVTNSNQPATGWTNDIIATLNNQVYIGSRVLNEVRVSSNTSFTTYTFSSPRVPGEGATLILDESCVALVPQEEAMYIAAGRSSWYKTQFDLSDDNVREILSVKKLKTAQGMAPISHDLVAKSGDYVAFINRNQQLIFLGRLEQLELPNLDDMSDPIKPDFDDETFTNGHLKFHRNRLYIATPTNDRLYINESRVVQDENGKSVLIRFWQPPQLLPVRRLAVIGGNIYGHSSAVPETYRLFDDTDDNNRPFKAVAAFAYRNFGDRANLKDFDEYFAEGYIAGNTVLKVKLYFDFDGFTAQKEFEVNGANDDILFQPIDSGSLGDNPLGDSPLGDQPSAVSDLPKFRTIFEMTRTNFFELQEIFETDTQDARWKVLSRGPNVKYAFAVPSSIKV